MKTFLLGLLQFLIKLIWPRKKMDVNLNLPATAPDPLAVITAGEQLVGTVAGGVVQIDKEDNTPANNLAAIENHKLKVDQAAQEALEAGDVATLQKMWQAAAKLIMVAFLFSALGCNHQKMIEDGGAAPVAYYDPSTPPQYVTAFNSGVLDIIKDGNRRTVVITTNKAKGQPLAAPWVDKFGNHVFSVDGSVPMTDIHAQQDADAARLEGAKAP